jgi:hypothetical protein
MKKTAMVAGLASVLLGGLWLLQGMGFVHVRPILCFADCDPIQGASATWAIIGLVALLVGSAGVFWSLKSSKG